MCVREKEKVSVCVCDTVCVYACVCVKGGGGPDHICGLKYVSVCVSVSV